MTRVRATSRLATAALAALAVVTATHPASARPAGDGDGSGVERPRNEWALHLGLNLATFVGSDAERADLERRAAVAAGASYLIRPWRHFGLMLEALYSRKGAQGSLNTRALGASPGEVVSGTARFHYLELPVLGVWIQPVTHTTEVRVYAGPAFAIATATELERDNSSITPGAIGTTILDLSNYTRNTDLGGVVGAGVVASLGRMRVSLEGRWTRGSWDVDDSTAHIDARNSVFTFLAGVGMVIVH